jgi:hypothetical protein
MQERLGFALVNTRTAPLERAGAFRGHEFASSATPCADCSANRPVHANLRVATKRSKRASPTKPHGPACLRPPLRAPHTAPRSLPYNCKREEVGHAPCVAGDASELTAEVGVCRALQQPLECAARAAAQAPTSCGPSV